MGIRIRNLIGYGLADLASGEIDPRLGVALERLLERLDEDLEAADFVGWLERRKAECADPEERSALGLTLGFIKAGLGWKPYESVQHDGEFGDPRVLILVPAGFQRRWIRYGDIIDYCLFVAAEGSSVDRRTPRARALPDGIHPFDQNWVDVRDGRRLPDGTGWILERAREDGNGHEEFLERAGFGSLQEALAFARPAVPPCVRHICEWLGILSDPAHLRTLRPMVHTCFA